MTTAIQRFAEFTVQRDPLSDAVRQTVRLHVIDTVAAQVAGTRTTEGKALLRFREQVGSSEKVPRDLMTLTALARLTEIDDIHLASMTTPGAIAIPGALAIASEQGELDADALPESIVAGYEAMIRLGLALDGPTILYRGIWPTYMAAPFGIAATASRLLRLDAAQTANALALALTYAAPGVGQHHAASTARWLSVGQAARNGLAAAEAAQAGFTADLALLDGGFFPGIYNVTPNTAAFNAGLGERSPLLDLSFKPWCAARQTMAATQALKEIMADGVAAADILAVKAAVLPPHRKMIDHDVRPGDRASYLTSVQYTMAVAALVPALADVLSPAPEDVPDAVHALMRRITVEPDETLLADYPRVWPAHVTVTTKTGTHERRVTAVPGDPSRPFGEADVTAKFRRFVAPVVGREGGDRLLFAAFGVIAGDRSARDLLQAIQSVA